MKTVPEVVLPVREVCGCELVVAVKHPRGSELGWELDVCISHALEQYQPQESLCKILFGSASRSSLRDSLTDFAVGVLEEAIREMFPNEGTPEYVFVQITAKSARFANLPKTRIKAGPSK